MRKADWISKNRKDALDLAKTGQFSYIWDIESHLQGKGNKYADVSLEDGISEWEEWSYRSILKRTIEQAQSSEESTRRERFKEWIQAVIREAGPVKNGLDGASLSWSQRSILDGIRLSGANYEIHVERAFMRETLIYQTFLLVPTRGSTRVITVGDVDWSELSETPFTEMTLLDFARVLEPRAVNAAKAALSEEAENQR